MARKLGKGEDVIRSIVRGKSYKSSGGTIHAPSPRKVPADIRHEIKTLYKKGDIHFGATALARTYGVDRHTILKIVKET